MISESTEENIAGLITDKWLAQFEETVVRVGRNHLMSDVEAHRLVALSMVCVLMSHQMLSELGGAMSWVPEIRNLFADLSQASDRGEAEPPSLAEMTVVMDMSATAFSLIAHRCGEIGAEAEDVPTRVIAGALVRVIANACKKGGPRAVATLLKVAESFAKEYRRT